MQSLQNESKTKSGSLKTGNQQNSFLISSGASTGANTKSGGFAIPNYYISVPSDHSSNGSALLIKENFKSQTEQLP